MGSSRSCVCSLVSSLVFVVAVCFVLAVAALFLAKPDEVALSSKMSLLRALTFSALEACLILGELGIENFRLGAGPRLFFTTSLLITISVMCLLGSLRKSTSFLLMWLKPSSSECYSKRLFIVDSDTRVRWVNMRLIVSKAPVRWVANLMSLRMTDVKLLLFC